MSLCRRRLKRCHQAPSLKTKEKPLNLMKLLTASLGGRNTPENRPYPTRLFIPRNSTTCSIVNLQVENAIKDKRSSPDVVNTIKPFPSTYESTNALVFLSLAYKAAWPSNHDQVSYHVDDERARACLPAANGASRPRYFSVPRPLTAPYFTYMANQPPRDSLGAPQGLLQSRTRFARKARQWRFVI